MIKFSKFCLSGGALGIFLSLSAYAESKVVNVYTWANYISDSVVQKFEKETGIEVRVTNYDNNEVLYSKLKTNPHIGYDVIVPSSYFITRMIKEDMLHKLNKVALPNIEHVNKSLLDKPYDPGNAYSLPYIWGTTGIMVNQKYWDPKQLQHWSDLWKPQFRNQVLVLDDAHEVFAIALITLGYSINTQDPRQIVSAYNLLKKLIPNIKLYNTNANPNMYADEDATLGMCWSGDAYLAMKENPDLRFIYPEEGFSVWMDCFAIPKHAPHLSNAEKFINFMMRPDIAKEIILSAGYPVANTSAIKLLPKETQKNVVLNPTPQILARGKSQLDVGDAITTYQKHWQLLKLGGD